MHSLAGEQRLQSVNVALIYPQIKIVKRPSCGVYDFNSSFMSKDLNVHGISLMKFLRVLARGTGWIVSHTLASANTKY